MRRACDHGRHRHIRLLLCCAALAIPFGISVQRARAAETIFLQDGRIIHADKVEIRGDTVKIEKPSETIEIPRSEVFSIHSSVPPKTAPEPADVYRDTTRQMNDKVRKEIENRPKGSVVR